MFVSDRMVWCLYIITNFAYADFAADYYFRGSLRTSPEELTCDSVVLKQFCESKCGEAHACLFGKCFCLQSNKEQPSALEKVPHKENHFLDFDDYSDVTTQKSESSKRPALRHQIAHFCPNLDEARKCIRKCMESGKPAFCGKDHVCYCGHKYTSHDKDEKMDPEDVYAQFRDLYTKYFGPLDDDNKGGDKQGKPINL